MRMEAVRSLRGMTRLLNTDPRLRKLCLIKQNESGYPRSVLSRFTRKVGEDNLNKIIDEKVIKLLKTSFLTVLLGKLCKHLIPIRLHRRFRSQLNRKKDIYH